MDLLVLYVSQIFIIDMPKKKNEGKKIVPQTDESIYSDNFLSVISQSISLCCAEPCSKLYTEMEFSGRFDSNNLT